MNIVFASASGALGGAETSLLAVMKSVRDENPTWKLTLLTGESGSLVSEASRLGIGTVTLQFPQQLGQIGDSSLKGSRKGLGRLRYVGRLVRAGASAIAYSAKLRAALSADPPDLIHANGFKMQLLCAVAKPGSVRLIWHIHDYVTTRPVVRWLLALASFRCDDIIANSDSVASNVRQVVRSGVDVTRVYNAVDCTDLSPAGPAADLDRLAGAPPTAPGVIRVGMVATFATWKGHDVFLRAIALLDSRLPFRAYIIGGPLYQTQGSQHTLEDLQAVRSRLGLEKRVGFTGFLKNRAEAFRSLDVVVHASTEPEPFGMVIIEAMSCGRALVAASGGGASELTVHDVDSLVHRRGDAKDLAVQIERLIRDQELRTRISTQGRAKALSRFSMTGLAGQLRPIYLRTSS
ncbi:putative glycosyl transferase [Bryobacterales bacterium F-183]|nr:putative glycosyl transferase [Bryobacterales bacterium F-183]